MLSILPRRALLTIAMLGIMGLAFDGQAEPYEPQDEPLVLIFFESPPFYHTDEQGNHSGIYYQLLTKTAEEAGFAYRIESYPPKRSFLNFGLNKNHVSFGPLFRETYGQVAHAGRKLHSLTAQVYALAGTSVPQTQAGFSQTHLIAHGGWTYGGLIYRIQSQQHQVEITFAPSVESLFNMLNLGRAPYAIMYAEIAAPILATYPKGTFVQGDIEQIDMHLQVSKKTPDGLRILQELEDAYDRLLARGEISLPSRELR